MDENEPKHGWGARFGVAIVMLLLAVIGLIVTDVSRDTAWNYWRVIVPVYALLAVGLSSYLRHKKLKDAVVSIWHELLQWLGLLLAVYLVSVLVNIGVMDRFDAALVVLLLLALTTYIAGIYTDISFMPIGILLGLFVVGAAMTEIYLYPIMIPLSILAVIVIWFLIRLRGKIAL